MSFAKSTSSEPSPPGRVPRVRAGRDRRPTPTGGIARSGIPAELVARLGQRAISAL